MEEIIGILVALGVLLFKVAKKINDADTPVRPAQPAQPTATRQYQTLEDIFPELRVDSEESNEEIYEEVPEEPEPIVEEAPTYYFYEAPKSVKEKPVVSRPIEVEPETSEKKEKIDPKKLVLYSEIMNRKY
jgi:hypothetical protein